MDDSLSISESCKFLQVSAHLNLNNPLSRLSRSVSSSICCFDDDDDGGDDYVTMMMVVWLGLDRSTNRHKLFLKAAFISHFRNGEPEKNESEQMCWAAETANADLGSVLQNGLIGKQSLSGLNGGKKMVQDLSPMKVGV